MVNAKLLEHKEATNDLQINNHAHGKRKDHPGGELASLPDIK